MAEARSRKVTFGLKDLVLWFEDDSYETAVRVPGIIELKRSMATSTADIYADDRLHYRKVDEKNGESTLDMADIPDEVKARMLGWRIDSKGGLVHMKDAEPTRFHAAFSISSDTVERRKFIYGCEASMAADDHETRGENVSFRHDEATLTEFGVDVGGEHVWDYVVNKDTDPEGYEKSFAEVVFPQPAEAGGAEGPDVSLSALTIGSLELTPSFDPDTTRYECTTSNATNSVAATPSAAGAVAVIRANGETVESGSSVTWNDGENTVVVTVINEAATRSYTVTVTKSE